MAAEAVAVVRAAAPCSCKLCGLLPCTSLRGGKPCRRPHSARLPTPQLEAVTCGYRRSRPVLQGVTLCVEQGERVALVGANGQGKSTLVKTILSEIAPLAGAVQTHG